MDVKFGHFSSSPGKLTVTFKMNAVTTKVILTTEEVTTTTLKITPTTTKIILATEEVNTATLKVIAQI